MMIEQYTIDNLTQNEVSVKKQLYMDYMGVQYPIGEPWRRSYMNSELGRTQITEDLPAAQVNAIISVWGDTPTIVG